ncbi:CCT motif family protein [Zostera marina]|uniref:CCT motif family protein n=1 Tax=Zostera marina TaxID=29655 RepID=A0A0K9P4J7_ZOSMR|nr:CCT motif family protein [Zostera marina]
MYIFDSGMMMMMQPGGMGLGFFQEETQNQNFHINTYNCNNTANNKLLLPNITGESMNNLDDYDPSGEGSLFKAPESIMEESELQLDPMAEAISMMSNGGDLTTEDPLLSDVYYECQKDILANSASGQPFSELSNLQIPILDMEMKEYEANREKSDINVDQIQRSVGSTCQKPTSPCNFKGKYLRPNFLDFEQMGLADALGIRKAHSQEDIKTIGNEIGNGKIHVTPKTAHHSAHETVAVIANEFNNTERKQKLSRYRKKKERRNFGRKIKYACRKALADNQLRVRGRFAKI